MDIPGYDDWKCTPPPDEPCDCGNMFCEQCVAREDEEARYWKWVDDRIDEARGK